MKMLGKFLLGAVCQLSITTAFAVEPGQIAKLLANDALPGDRAGVSVAISGDTAVVGTDQGVVANAGPGAAYIFTKSNTGRWYQETKLTASDGNAGDGFGNSVSIDADTIVVGAPGDDDKGGLSGSAYVFVRNSDGTWPATETLKLTASDGESLDGFGRAVAISGQTIFVGAPWNGPGEVYVFYPTTAGGWVEGALVNNFFDVSFLYADDPNARFGWSISAVSSIVETPGDLTIDGVIVTIGAPWEDTFGKAWTLRTDHASVIDLAIFPPDQLGLPLVPIHVAEHDPCIAGLCLDEGDALLFGWSVDIDAGPGLSSDEPNKTYVFAIVGAPGYDHEELLPDFTQISCVDAGAASVYRYDDVNSQYPFTTQQLGVRCHDNARIGWTVAISLERRGTILLGAPFYNPSGFGTPGFVFGLESAAESLTGFSNLSTNDPTEDPYNYGRFALFASDYSFGNSFGSAVALDGNSALIGSRGDNSLTGSAYLFQQTPLFASRLLINFIASLNLRSGIEKSLTIKASQIETAIDNGDVNLALNLANAFIEDVDEKTGTQLTLNQAGKMLFFATEIVSLLTFY